MQADANIPMSELAHLRGASATITIAAQHVPATSTNSKADKHAPAATMRLLMLMLMLMRC